MAVSNYSRLVHTPLPSLLERYGDDVDDADNPSSLPPVLFNNSGMPFISLINDDWLERLSRTLARAEHDKILCLKLPNTRVTVKCFKKLCAQADFLFVGHHPVDHTTLRFRHSSVVVENVEPAYLTRTDREAGDKSVMRTLCWTCSALGPLQCKRCKLARYCSSKCQRADYRLHAQYCRHIAPKTASFSLV